MNSRFYQMAVRGGRSFSAKTRTKPSSIGDFSGISPAWRPFGPIANDVLGTRFTDEFDDESCRRLARTVDEAPMDCKESLKDFHIQINLPGKFIDYQLAHLSTYHLCNTKITLKKGLQKEDISVNIQDRMLSVSAELKGMSRNEGDSFRKIERFRGHIMRSVSLPHGVDENGVRATYKDGVLDVNIPKTTEAEQPNTKTITVE